jgi:hypothetical protein
MPCARLLSSAIHIHAHANQRQAREFGHDGAWHGADGAESCFELVQPDCSVVFIPGGLNHKSANVGKKAASGPSQF